MALCMKKMFNFGIFLHVSILLCHYYEYILLGTPLEAAVYTVTLFGLHSEFSYVRFWKVLGKCDQNSLC